MRAAVFLLFLLLCLPAIAQQQDPITQFEVTNLMKESARAWNRGDLDAFMGDYLRSDQVTFTSGGKVLKGYEALTERYRTTYGDDRASMGRLQFSEIEVWKLGPEAALALGRWRLMRADKEELDGVFSLVLTKKGGKWKILHDHTSRTHDESQEVEK